MEVSGSLLSFVVMEKIAFETGGVWDYNGFDINVDHPVIGDRDYVPCKHAIEHPNSTDQLRVYTVPFVAVQYNEGGFCDTGTCAQCIAEALETLIPKPDNFDINFI